MKPSKPTPKRREATPGAQPAHSSPRGSASAATLRGRALGDAGETHAAAHLAARGWRVLARNVRAGGVELDLVARRHNVLAIVEVKTRRNEFAGAPEEAVDGNKRARIVRGAAAWLRDNPQRRVQVRFDVIVCEGEVGAWRVRHLEAAFDAGD